MIDQNQPPVRIDQDIGLVPVGVVDEVVEHAHIPHLPIPGAGFGRQYVFPGPLPVGHGVFCPQLQRSLFSFEGPVNGRRHIVQTQQTVHFVGGDFSHVAVEKIPLLIDGTSVMKVRRNRLAFMAENGIDFYAVFFKKHFKRFVDTDGNGTYELKDATLTALALDVQDLGVDISGVASLSVSGQLAVATL